MRTESSVRPRTLVRTTTLALCALLSGCGSGGGGAAGGGTGGGGGGTVSGTKVALETSAVSGPNIDGAIGDTGVWTITGTLPGITALGDPVLVPEATDISASGNGSIHDSDGSSVDVHVVSATEIDFTDHVRSFDGSGHVTSTVTSGTSQNTVLPFVAPAAPGLYELTVTQVTHTNHGTAVGQKAYAVISANGQLSVHSDFNEQGLVGLVHKATGWKAQVSSAEGAVVTTATFSFANDFSTGTYFFGSAGTFTEELVFTAAKVTVPSAVSGVKTGAAASDYDPGSAPGFTSTTYALAHVPAHTALATTINADATTITVGSETFTIKDFFIDDVGHFAFTGVRFFTDATLPFASNLVFENVLVTSTAAGVSVTGDGQGITFILAADPTPDDNGAGNNDDLLGDATFVP